MGGWAVAQSPILVTTITMERLKKRGNVSMSEIYAIISSRLNELGVADFMAKGSNRLVCS